MTTKTEKLRTALLSRGFAPTEHKSQRECLTGLSVQGTPLWIWLDKMGGARFSRSTRKGDAFALSGRTIEKLLAGKSSNLIPGGNP
jgi:hypothetical protein